MKEYTFVRAFQSARNEANWQWRFECMEEFNIWLITSGRGMMYINSERIVLQRGVCLLIPPGVAGRAVQRKANRLGTMAVHFSTPDLSSPVQLRYGIIDNLPFFQTLMERVISFGWAGDQRRADLWLGCLLEELHVSQTIHGELEPYREQIDGICRQVVFAPERNWNIEDMAKRLHLCRAHFSRIFKQLRGQSPKDFVIKARVNKAKGLLVNTTASISEIAELCGYASEYFFSRQFKQQVQYSPTQMRALSRSGGGSR